MMPARGLVLVAVLWVTAALGLLTTAVLGTVRTEARSLLVHREQLQAQALGDALIVQALIAVHRQARSPERAEFLGPFEFDGVSALVTVRPVNGWIDLNRAPDALLTQVLVQAGGLDPAVAANVVQNLGRSTGRRFDSVAELAGIPGVSYGVYAKVQGVLTVHGLRSSAGAVNPLAAPGPVLRVLSGGNEALVASLLAAQSTQAPAPDFGAIDPSWVSVASSNRQVFEVSVGAWQRRWWVDLAGGTGPLPWRVIAQETLGQPDLPSHAN